MKARDYMSAPPLALPVSMPLEQAIETLLATGFSAAPVIGNHGNLVGILTEKDCFGAALRTGYYANPSGSVAEYMSTPVETIEADTDVATLIQFFHHSPHRRFPVVDGSRLVGQLSRRDVLRALADLAWGAPPSR